MESWLGGLVALLAVAAVPDGVEVIGPEDLLPAGDTAWTTSALGPAAEVSFEILEEITPWAAVNSLYFDTQQDGWGADGAVIGTVTNDVLIFQGADGIGALVTRALPPGVNLSLHNDAGSVGGVLDLEDSYLNTNPAFNFTGFSGSQFLKYFVAERDVAYRFGSTFLGSGFSAFLFLDDDHTGPNFDFNDMIIGVRCVAGAEICDGFDNDCDGAVDEDFPELGAPCTNGLGACERSGVTVCRGDGSGTECDAIPGPPEPERCNAIDDDCDGLVDEDFPDLGQPCTVGEQECEASGTVVCNADGSDARCDAIQCTIAAEAQVPSGTSDHVASVDAGSEEADYAWTVIGGSLTAGNGTPSILYRAGPGPALTISVTVTEPSGCQRSCRKEVTVLFTDCDDNGIPDGLDIANCPGTPDCDDCNLNGLPDACDLEAGTSLDVDLDGVPDECIETPADGVDWSDDIWDLVGDNPYPDNVSGVPDLHVTLDAVGLFLDVTVEVDTLRLLNGAALQVTQLAGGDFTATDPGGIFSEGSFLVDRDRVISVPAGAFTLGAGGQYLAAPQSLRGLFGSVPAGSQAVSASLTAESITLLPTICGETDQMTLSGQMTVTTTGDFTLDGSGVVPCPFAGGQAAAVVGGQTPPSLRLRKVVPFSGGAAAPGGGPQTFTRANIGGAFRMLDAAVVCVGCNAGANALTPNVVLQGDFDNQSRFPELFNWLEGGLVLTGTQPRNFEVGGDDLGVTPDGFGTADNRNFAMGRLEVGPDTPVRFRNRHTNTVGAGPCLEALYVDTLVLQGGSTVTLDNVRVYYFVLEDHGATIETVGCGALVSLCVSDPPSTTVTPKNRYLSLSAGNSGLQTAIRVTLSDLPPPFNTLDGTTMWVGAPRDVGEIAALSAPTAPFANLKVATLQCNPVYSDWSTVGTVHVYHEFIVPGGVYEIQTLTNGCLTSDEGSFSAAAPMTMSRWGDMVGDFEGNQWAAPDGRVDLVRDVVALIDKFGSRSGAPSKVRTDLDPATPDQLITVGDLAVAVDAFRGLPYPYLPGPVPCP